MNDAQTWTLIGGFIAVIGLMGTMLLRTVEAKIDSLGNRFEAKFDSVDARFDSLRAEMNTRFVSIEGKIDGLDRDVQALTSEVFHRREDS